MEAFKKGTSTLFFYDKDIDTKKLTRETSSIKTANRKMLLKKRLFKVDK